MWRMARKSDHGTHTRPDIAGAHVFFLRPYARGGEKMPRNQFQRMFFAFVTVVITVHAYVFYSLYVVNGSLLMNLTGESSVICAINAQGGVVLLPVLYGI